jgi:hypothetical protein
LRNKVIEDYLGFFIAKNGWVMEKGDGALDIIGSERLRIFLAVAQEYFLVKVNGSRKVPVRNEMKSWKKKKIWLTIVAAEAYRANIRQNDLWKSHSQILVWAKGNFRLKFKNLLLECSRPLHQLLFEIAGFDDATTFVTITQIDHKAILQNFTGLSMEIFPKIFSDQPLAHIGQVHFMAEQVFVEIQGLTLYALSNFSEGQVPFYNLLIVLEFLLRDLLH